VAAPEQPVFYYDLGSPQCYLLGETIMSTLPMAPEWEPVLASQFTAGIAPKQHLDRLQIERLADKLGLQRLRWPSTWPPDATRAMLAATYAKKIGRGVAFSLAAFRQTFAGGRDIGDDHTILIAGAACEIHPAALTKGVQMASTADALQTANMRARAAGVSTLPAIQMDGRTYEGAEAMALGGAR
jgi:2-hydroxychromene-2-carboxylate isomerase